MPNRLEICFADQRIIQIPVNKVQTENENHFGLALSYHQHDLNRMFLGGARIADEPFYDVKTPSIHWELGYRFV
jgi:hypothetical protein